MQYWAAGPAPGRAGGGAASLRGSPGRRGPSRQALGPPPPPPPPRPSSLPSPTPPSPTALSLSFFPGPARPHPGGARSAARPMAELPGRASADPPGLRASGSQSGRRGRPRLQIKRAGPQTALQSREWEKSRLCKQFFRPPRLSSPHLALAACPPCRLLAAQVSAWPARGARKCREPPRSDRSAELGSAPSHLQPLLCAPACGPSRLLPPPVPPGGSGSAMAGRASRQGFEKGGELF